MELLSRLELPNLFLTKEALYRLSYNSISYYACVHILLSMPVKMYLRSTTKSYYNTNSPNMQQLFS